MGSEMKTNSLEEVLEKVKEFENEFDGALCRVSLCRDGSGDVEYSVSTEWVHIKGFDTISQFMKLDVKKLRKVCKELDIEQVVVKTSQMC